MEIQYAHIGNNFTLTFQDPAQRDIQRTQDIVTGQWGRSYDESVFLRPTQSVDITTSYFRPAMLGGDHAFKLGYRWRTAEGQTFSHTGGFATARFSGTTPNSADLFRDGSTDYNLLTHAAYLQDTYSVKRLTMNLGVRWDRQSDEALPTQVPANPIIPQIMPAIDFPGIRSGVVWNNFSPRLGLTYDLLGTGRSIAKASYSIYYGQLAPGQLSGNLVSVGQVFVRYPWNDANGDTFVQANELNTTTVLSKSTAFDPAKPSNFLSPGTNDPNVKDDRTRELIVGFQQELRRNLGLEINYIWRKYDRFQWSDRLNWDSSNFQAITLNPPANCTARCETIIYYKPRAQQPSPFIYTNTPDRWRDYNGAEIALTKRYANRWMATASFAYNSAIEHWGSPAAFEDPTNIDKTEDAQFAPESGGSGIDNVYTNATWLFKAGGVYTTPRWDVNLAVNTEWRQGYPFPQAINVTNRGNGVGDTLVLLDPLGGVRLPDVYTLDFKVEKALTFRTLRVIPSMDVFNLTNANTVLSRRRNQYTFNATTAAGSTPDNADLISSIVSPRVIRFGLRVNW